MPWGLSEFQLGSGKTGMENENESLEEEVGKVEMLPKKVYRRLPALATKTQYAK